MAEGDPTFDFKAHEQSAIAAWRHENKGQSTRTIGQMVFAQVIG